MNLADSIVEHRRFVELRRQEVAVLSPSEYPDIAPDEWRWAVCSICKTVDRYIHFTGGPPAVIVPQHWFDHGKHFIWDLHSEDEATLWLKDLEAA